MTFIANTYILLIQLISCLIEFYLFLSLLRLVLRCSTSARSSHYYYQSKLLTDPLPQAAFRLLSKYGKVPGWVPWTVVILSGCLLRQILIMSIN